MSGSSTHRNWCAPSANEDIQQMIDNIVATDEAKKLAHGTGQASRRPSNIAEYIIKGELEVIQDVYKHLAWAPKAIREHAQGVENSLRIPPHELVNVLGAHIKYVQARAQGVTEIAGRVEELVEWLEKTMKKIVDRIHSNGMEHLVSDD